ncbi:hypothetical protein AVEN_90372-1 [Araneus ventricosus]|uniref:Uncharacterized protein n=1 Tax=Araneus ventricosus TaxID=182803 RepID=A0A4Y2EMT6_ARAVE|nr:hypothetical protein AVEN_141878-1 [Araneus ventricosus]GBM30510.1 hypothetical protein AVEN_90372-1 [Araneus ventricosus]
MSKRKTSQISSSVRKLSSQGSVTLQGALLFLFSHLFKQRWLRVSYFFKEKQNVKGFSSKSKHCIQYPNVHSAMRPVPHSEDLPIPTAPDKYTVDSEDDTSDDPNHQDPDFQPSTSMTCSHHEITQAELNDLVQDLKLSQTDS